MQAWPAHQRRRGILRAQRSRGAAVNFVVAGAGVLDVVRAVVRAVVLVAVLVAVRVVVRPRLERALRWQRQRKQPQQRPQRQRWLAEILRLPEWRQGLQGDSARDVYRSMECFMYVLCEWSEVMYCREEGRKEVRVQRDDRRRRRERYGEMEYRESIRT